MDEQIITICIFIQYIVIHYCWRHNMSVLRQFFVYKQEILAIVEISGFSLEKMQTRNSCDTNLVPENIILLIDFALPINRFLSLCSF